MSTKNRNKVFARPQSLAAVQSSGDVPTIYIYDEIGKSDWYPMVSAADVIGALQEIGRVAQINVRINSPGGDVFEGDAIYNALMRCGAKVNVFIDGVAASAASFIAMAGDSIEIAENGFFMIHEAWTMTWGNKGDLQKSVELLSKIDSVIASIYAARSGGTAEDFSAKMAAETWYTAKEAIDAKLADKIGQTLKTGSDTAAKLVAKFRHAPDPIKQLAKEHQTKSEESTTPRRDRLAAFLRK